MDISVGRESEFEHAAAAWAEGVRSELRFWRKQLRLAANGKCPELVGRTTPNRPVLAALRDCIPDHNECRILDVGAGPLSLCGSHLDGRRKITVVPIDPLASFYGPICREFGIIPPIATEFGFAEDVSAQFAEGSFDIAFSVNALDHTINPVGAITEMLIVTKIGGTIYLNHALNEGALEGYRGFHQWNFAQEGDEFVIWNRKGSTSNISRLLAGVADIEVRTEGTRVCVYITKLAEPVDDLIAFHRLRRAAHLKAFVLYIAENQLPPPFGGPDVRRRALKTVFRMR
jgi:SAM-dependent methyltransferase